ncbi:HAD domain-containing protein [Azospirillum sp.]|uniref:HAD domain-containing protein n=1 Tax=Azospirillum sp. TaxID=34012 RepID=UPI003D7615FD
MKVVFLDIDGPMIPQRAYYLPENHGKLVTRFDPVAVWMVLRLLHLAPAKLVISSTWRKHGRERMAADLTVNGICPSHLHDDWSTGEHRDEPLGRAKEIMGWMDRHPEVTHYAAIDDERLELPGEVRTTFHDGMQMGHFKLAGDLLDIDWMRLSGERLAA